MQANNARRTSANAVRGGRGAPAFPGAGAVEEGWREKGCRLWATAVPAANHVGDGLKNVSGEPETMAVAPGAAGDDETSRVLGARSEQFAHNSHPAPQSAL
ncbi:hypothetical protein GSI_01473 [Ganoderma sinense ZZ0214-1]|uniref:Uncharacterized protein n=1 Tax=Ganoderma sinense ZZ0214-1 TaxID=1077348 RepID=A0A2G8SQ23_9APHY|nr:hypothetical protein GSI_01473 [Ganoderma sinense ZZ0214-1]